MKINEFGERICRTIPNESVNPQKTKGKRDMNKQELVSRTAKSAGVKKEDTEKVIKALAGVITEAVAAEDKVTIADLGIFSCKHRAARTARNPRTGEEVSVPASKAPAFKPASAFMAAV